MIAFLFLSTPSARRATRLAPFRQQRRAISIHALREEGDGAVQGIGVVALRISIHALREEGDPLRVRISRHPIKISIHALREEGDLTFTGCYRGEFTFLSTPSARRATAKTERTPSAFVLLYTSVHKLQRGICHTNRSTAPFLA